MGNLRRCPQPVLQPDRHLYLRALLRFGSGGRRRRCAQPVGFDDHHRRDRDGADSAVPRRDRGQGRAPQTASGVLRRSAGLLLVHSLVGPPGGPADHVADDGGAGDRVLLLRLFRSAAQRDAADGRPAERLALYFRTGPVDGQPAQRWHPVLLPLRPPSTRHRAALRRRRTTDRARPGDQCTATIRGSVCCGLDAPPGDPVLPVHAGRRAGRPDLETRSGGRLPR